MCAPAAAVRGPVPCCVFIETSHILDVEYVCMCKERQGCVLQLLR
jgi:hypothetical protein